jgi:cathepsin L
MRALWGETGGLGTERGYAWVRYDSPRMGAYASWVVAARPHYVVPKMALVR